MMRIGAGIVSVLAPLAFAGPGAPAPAPPPPELMVYAAASLRNALEALRPACERATGTKLAFNFGASNDLARQITAAGKADVFLSADESWMDAVENAGLVDRASRRALLSNTLVVVAPSASALSIGSAAGLAAPSIERLSLAQPEAVPAGKYAKAWLEREGVWEALRSRVVPAVDVRAALAAVEAGIVDAGVVYRTDAAVSRSVRVIYEVPASAGPPISYPVAALVDRPNLPAARRVVDWLAGAEAAAIFENWGFILPRREGSPGR